MPVSFISSIIASSFISETLFLNEACKLSTSFCSILFRICTKRFNLWLSSSVKLSSWALIEVPFSDFREFGESYVLSLSWEFVILFILGSYFFAYKLAKENVGEEIFSWSFIEFSLWSLLFILWDFLILIDLSWWEIKKLVFL